MADVETGIGPFVATYLSAAHHFNPRRSAWLLARRASLKWSPKPPAGWLIVRLRRKRMLIAGAALVIALGSFFVVKASGVASQMANQIAIGLAAAFVAPTVNAITLDLTGSRRFARRIGRNAAFSHGGNVTTAVVAGFVGYAAGERWIFYGCAALGAAVLAAISFIRERDIDHDAARALPEGPRERGQVRPVADIFRKTEMALFVAIVLLFHFQTPPCFRSPDRNWPGRNAGRHPFTCPDASLWRRRLWSRSHTARGGLPIRWGANPSFWRHSSRWACAAFCSRSVGGRFISSASKRWTGWAPQSRACSGAHRFGSRAGHGAIQPDAGHAAGLQAAVGTGAFLGNSVAGLIAKSEGFPAAFAALSAVAAIGFALYRARMPETRAGNESLAPPPG